MKKNCLSQSTAYQEALIRIMKNKNIQLSMILFEGIILLILLSEKTHLAIFSTALTLLQLGLIYAADHYSSLQRNAEDALLHQDQDSLENALNHFQAIQKFRACRCILSLLVFAIPLALLLLLIFS